MKGDDLLFGRGWLPALRGAVGDLCWLLSGGYSERAALKLVGDHHGLDARQRKAVASCSCSDAALHGRQARRLPSVAAAAGRTVLVDGLNCLITVQTALSGGLVLRGRDGCHRDLAGVHGAFRVGRWTRAAMGALAEQLGDHPVRWYLDRPVSGSGELRRLLLQGAGGRPWEVELHPDPDQVLAAGEPVATADSGVLDRCGQWIDLVGLAMAGLPTAWVVDLGSDPLETV